MSRRALRVGIVGGGPAGLYLARLLRRSSRGCEVELFERNAPDSTFGFGVAFSQRTLQNLEAADAQTHAAILQTSRGWDGMMLTHRDRSVRWSGFGLDAISRTALLALLQEAAAASGAVLHFEREVALDELTDYDVVVAADGANSAVREGGADAFGTSRRLGTAKYMWLGSTGPFDRTSFCIRTDAAGAFAIHAYPYSPTRATLVAEVDEAVWRRAGLDAHAHETLAPGVSDEKSAAYLAHLFAPDLEGHELLLNNSKWLSFPTIRNERWSSGNVVLVGDAAHTAHPSVASGTKLAMEDAIVLARELSSGAELAEALSRYEAERRPDVEHVQRRAALSQRWWETLHRRIGMTAEQLAFSYVSRAGAVDLRKLERIAPSLTRSALRSFRGGHPRPGDSADGPLLQPLDVGGRRLSGRVLSAQPEDRGGSPVAMLLRANGRPADLVAALRSARSREPSALLAAELPTPCDGRHAVDPVALAEQLRAAGCDIIAVPFAGPDAEVAERIRLEVGLPTLTRCRDEQLDLAATHVLAGRIDLVARLDGAEAAHEGLAVRPLFAV